MPLGPTNCTISIEFELTRTFVDGRPKETTETRDFRASFQADWLQVSRVGGAVTTFNPNEARGFQGKEKITVAITDAMPYKIEPDMRVTVNPDNEILDTKEYRVFQIPIVPDVLGPPEYILWLGEVKES